MVRRHFIGIALATPLLLASAHEATAAAYTFNFESDPLAQPTPFSSVSSSLRASFAGPSAVDPGAFEISYNSASGPFPAPYLTLSGAFLATGNAFGAPGSALSIAFNQPLTGLSLKFGLGRGSDTLMLLTNDGGSATARGGTQLGYANAEGLLTISNRLFTTVTLSTGAISLAIDDVVATVAEPATLPEPASLLLVGAGLLGAAGLRRRRAA